MGGFRRPTGRAHPSDEPRQRERLDHGNRIYVGNLPFSTTSEALRVAFASSGEVTDVHIVTDRESGQSRGLGFVTRDNAHEAAKAVAAMNGATFDGRSLRVNMGNRI